MRYLHTSIKIFLIAVIASLGARFFNLNSYLTAGVLGLLSVQLTKKDSLRSATDRFLAGLLGLGLSTLMFVIFSYSFIVYGAFILIFSYATFKLKISAGIAPSIVLVTHLLTKGVFDLEVILNALYLMIIAVIVSYFFNTFYPNFEYKKLNKYLSSVDQMIKDHVFMLHLLIKNNEDRQVFIDHYNLLSKTLDESIKEIQLLDNDLLFKNDHRHINYINMRREQFKHLKHIYELAIKLEHEHPFRLHIADFIFNLSKDIGDEDKASAQLLKLEELKLFFKESELPKTREEFELRAKLYQMLFDLEYFLNVKITFHLNYEDFKLK